MQRTSSFFLAAFVIAPLLILPAAAQSIVGNWLIASGDTVQISKCSSAYCITLRTGKYKGRQIGKMSGAGSKYSGTITDPTNNKTYTGSATVAARSMSVRGCVLGIFCRSQTWKKR